MLVSLVEGQKDSNNEIISRWDKFDLLKEAEKKLLISGNLPVVLKRISIQFNFSAHDAATLSRLIRSVYFGEIIKDKLVYELANKISSLTPENTKKIAQLCNDEIFSLVIKSREDIEIEKNKLSLIKISLSQALAQYPNIAEQNITSNQLRLKNSAIPMRPSIKNWIVDFHDAMGAMKHGPVDRGNFLFHGENSKSLTTADRQKLGVILKSLDEQTALTIDPIAQVVVFEKAQEEAAPLNHPIFASENVGTVNLRNTQNQVAPLSHHITSSENIGTVNLKQNVDQKPFQPSIAAAQTKKIVPEPIKNEQRVENFFQVPGSKPPIGSDTFNVPQKLEQVNAEKIEKVNMVSNKNADEMSDHELYEMLQNKKNTDSSNQAVHHNSAARSPRITFSSPQKFSNEDAGKTTESSQIAGSKIQQQNQKNVVNLRS